MYRNELEKLTGAAENKIRYMQKSPLGFLLLSACAAWHDRLFASGNGSGRTVVCRALPLAGNPVSGQLI